MKRIIFAILCCAALLGCNKEQNKGGESGCNKNVTEDIYVFCDVFYGDSVKVIEKYYEIKNIDDWLNGTKSINVDLSDKDAGVMCLVSFYAKNDIIIGCGVDLRDCKTSGYGKVSWVIKTFNLLMQGIVKHSGQYPDIEYSEANSLGGGTGIGERITYTWKIKNLKYEISINEGYYGSYNSLDLHYSMNDPAYD